MNAQYRERGFALVAAVFGLVIIATLVTGAFFAARQELKMGQNTQTFQRAFSAAEAGLNSTIANWATGTYNLLAVGDSSTTSATLANNTGSYTAYVRRLNDQLFLIRSVGADPTGLSQRTLATITRLGVVSMLVKAGLTTRNALKVGGSSFITGVDTPPSGWTCPSVHDTLAGILTHDSTKITYSGCNNSSCLEGNPKIQQDATINDSTFFKFGDTDWNDLVAMATNVYPTGNKGPLGPAPVGTATTCDATGHDNWGDPRKPATIAGCANYFPITYVNGDLKLVGGVGQGILLVSGDLTVDGGAEFFGPVIVRGHLATAGQGGHFNGGVMAADVDLEQNTVLGSAVITYSACAIATALNYSTPARVLRQRSWAELVY